MSLVSSHWYDRAIAAEAEVEALRSVNHSDPEVCPLWYDGCNCYEAFIYWRDRAEVAEARLTQLGSEDGVYVGTRQDWIDRAYAAEAKLAIAEAESAKLREQLGDWMSRGSKLAEAKHSVMCGDSRGPDPLCGGCNRCD